MSATVKISDETHQRLVNLANSTGRRMQSILEDAVAAYEANAFWTSVNTGYDRLAGNPARWGEVEAERTGEAPVLVDDLDHS